MKRRFTTRIAAQMLRTKRAMTFARRLLERYARRRATRTRLDMLLRLAPRALVQRILSRREVHRILTLLRTGPATAAIAAAATAVRATAQLPGTSRSAVPTAGAAEPPSVGGTRRALWLELVERRRRIEVMGQTPRALPTVRVAASAPETKTTRAPDRAASLLPLVARAARDPTPRPPRADSATAQDAPGPVDAARPPAARPTPPLPEPDIERLAERVIGTIDRRIAAQRERFGRP